MSHEIDRALLTAPDAGARNPFIGGVGGNRLELPETVIKKLLRFPLAFRKGLHSGNDHDEPPSAAHSRPDQAVARFARIPGLEPVGPVIVGEQRISIFLGDVVPGE